MTSDCMRWIPVLTLCHTHPAMSLMVVISVLLLASDDYGDNAGVVIDLLFRITFVQIVIATG